MKCRFRLFLSALICVIGLFCQSCSSQYQHVDTKPVILSMNRMIHDLVNFVVGDIARCDVLIDGAIDPHNYEIVKSDLDKFYNSEIIFCVGLGMESTASLKKQLCDNPKVVFLGDRLLSSGNLHVLEEDGFYDAHIWLDLNIWAQVVPLIVEHVIPLFPEYREQILERGRALMDRLHELDMWALKTISSIPEEKKFLVTAHNAFNYFARRYLSNTEEKISGDWQHRVMALEGICPESEISFRNIMRVVEYVHDHNVSVLFYEDTLNKDALKKVVTCSKKNHSLRLASDPIFSDNVNNNYFETFEHNVRVITKELGGYVS